MSRLNIVKLQEDLLAWYAHQRRAMPWRALTGKRANPYHVWLSEIMLQQTTVVTVIPYFLKFIVKWPTVEDLAAAQLDEVLTSWAGLGYYARARNLHKCAQHIVAEYKGHFPTAEEELILLPGVGPYTAAAIASIAFNRPAVAVDGNVERVVSRFFAIEEPLPQSKNILKEHAAKLALDNDHPADFTQAFMELGATVCTPRNPQCGRCPWQEKCRGFKLKIAANLPYKTAKAEKPVRYGKVFWIVQKSGAFLIEKREGKGLYEGMYQLPTTEWVTELKDLKKLTVAHADHLTFRPLVAEVRHSFTHFDLVLEIWHGVAPHKGFKPALGVFISPDKIEGYAIPSLMQKVIKRCMLNKMKGEA